jgi:DNA invertase Pin-like site-specific DNA recombinase
MGIAGSEQNGALQFAGPAIIRPPSHARAEERKIRQGSMSDLVAITSKLKAKGVELQILAMNLDTSTPTGKLMLNLMGSFAEFERKIMLERQREGVARAKADGKYKGRVPTAQRKAAEVVQLRGQGLKPEAIGQQLGISRASVFRVLKGQRS